MTYKVSSGTLSLYSLLISVFNLCCRPVVYLIRSQEAQTVHSLSEHDSGAGIWIDDVHHETEALGDCYSATPNRATGYTRISMSIIRDAPDRDFRYPAETGI